MHLPGNVPQASYIIWPIGFWPKIQPVLRFPYFLNQCLSETIRRHTNTQGYDLYSIRCMYSVINYDLYSKDFAKIFGYSEVGLRCTNYCVETFKGYQLGCNCTQGFSESRTAEDGMARFCKLNLASIYIRRVPDIFEIKMTLSHFLCW